MKEGGADHRRSAFSLFCRTSLSFRMRLSVLPSVLSELEGSMGEEVGNGEYRRSPPQDIGRYELVRSSYPPWYSMPDKADNALRRSTGGKSLPPIT